MLLLENNSLQGDNSKSTSHHPDFLFYTMTAHPVMFYSSPNEICLAQKQI